MSLASVAKPPWPRCRADHVIALRKIADGLIGLSASIGALGLLFEGAVILFDVVGRAVGSPLYGSQDLIMSGMVILVFGAMALCDRGGGHIAVDLFERYYPARMNRIIDIVSALLGAVIFAGLAWAVLESAKLSVMLNLSTNLLYIPKAWVQWALVAFAALTSLGMVLRAVELALRGYDVRQEPKETLL
jgi:TRAP-type C4-dicarboxylate transport system permease small subunit